MEIAALTLDSIEVLGAQKQDSQFPGAEKRFIKVSGAYAQAVYAADWSHAERPKSDTDDVRPALALIELDMNLPDEAVQYPVVEIDNIGC